MKQLSNENDAHAQPQQAQNENQDTRAMHDAFQRTRRIE